MNMSVKDVWSKVPMAALLLATVVGCGPSKTTLTIDDTEMSGSVEIVNRTNYDVERICDDASRRKIESFLQPLIPAQGVRFVKLCHYYRYGDDKGSVGRVKVFCNGRWSKLLLWSKKHNRFLWWRRMTLYNVTPSACHDLDGNSQDEHGNWYWSSDFDIDALQTNRTLYLFEVKGDIVLCNRDLSDRNR